MSKAAYESTLGPLFNDKIDPALKSALDTSNATRPQNLTTAIGLVKEARDAMAGINPPTAISDLNKKAVDALTSLTNDLTNLRSAVESKNTSAYTSAANAVKNDGLQLENVGNQFTARGY